MNKSGEELEALERVLQDAPCGVGLFEIGTDTVLFLNKAYYEMVGYTPEAYKQARAQSVTDRILPPDVGIKKRSAQEFARTGHAQNYEYRILRPDGRVRWFQMNSSTIYADGRPLAFASFTDITEEKELSAKLSLVAENVGSSLSLLRVCKGREELIYGNEEFFRNVGVDRASYCSNMEAYDRAMLPQADKERIDRAARQALESGKPGEVTHRLVQPDGRVRWFCRHFAAIRQDAPDTYLLVSLVTDVTEKQESDIKAALEQRRFQTVIAELNAAVFEWDLKTGQFYSSEAYGNYALSCVSTEDVLNNRGPRENVHPDDGRALEDFFAQTKRAEKGGERAETVLRLKMRDGTFRWCRMLGFYYYDADGVPVRIVGVIIDINDEHERSFMLSNLLNELPGGVAILRFENALKCTYFSDGFAALSGRTRAEVEQLFADGATLEDFAAPADRAGFANTLRRCTAEGHPLNITYRFSLKNGDISWIHLTAKKLREENGSPVYYCMFTVPSDEKVLYKSVVEDSAIGVFIAERGTRRVIYTNDAFEQITGLEHRSAEGRLLHDILAGTGKKPLVSDEQVVQLSANEYSEMHVERGSRYLAIKAKALLWNGIDSYILYIADETREHARQQQLQHAFDEMRSTRVKEQTLLASIPGGVAIYRLKKDGRAVMEYASEGLCRMLGFTEDELLSDPDAHVGIYPADCASVTEEINACIAAKRAVSMTYRILTKNRTPILTRLDAKVMHTDSLGTDDVALLYAVHTPVSEESKLAMEEQRHYRMILNMTGTAYFEWNREEGFYASSEYERYALSEGGYAALMGSPAGTACVHPDDRPVLVHYMGEVIGNSGGKSVTVRMKMKDGRFQWTEVIGYAERNQSDGFTRVIGVLRDVDKEWIARNRRLQAALDEAEKANRAKTAFLSRVSHDMRTPLNGILGLTSFLKDSVTDPQAVRDISQLEISGQYLLNLINDTLDVSRIENGKLELHPTVCGGRIVFENIIRLAKPNIEAKKLHFIVNAEKLSDTVLYMDVGRVEQIFMNILGNAVKFTPQNGTITLTIETIERTEHVLTDRVRICDTGIGMSADFLPHIFDAFSQADETQTNARQGTGLGMAITKQLVGLMGGEISVESTLGKGSCFTFTLPMPYATDAQIGQWKTAQEHETDYTVLRDKRILVCEDHPLNMQIATRLLQGRKMIVTGAENGLAGFERFKASAPNEFDAILMDIRMPQMDGLEATRKIRALTREDAHTVPIIAMTGNSFDEDVQHALDAGMNAHLSKPVDAAKLFATLVEMISSKHYYRRKKVLVVDDIALNRAIIRNCLEKDYELVEATDGAQALTLLAQETGIDAVITDIMMPHMDGVELIRRIRAQHEYDGIALIANTQYGEMTQEKTLTGLGADEFIYKPNTPEIVARRLRSALRKIAARQEK